MDLETINGTHVFVRDVAAASALIAIGAKLRQQMPVTAASVGGHAQITFWFDQGNVECGGVTKSVSEWLRLLLCPWVDFRLPLEHPVAFLKAAAENRKSLLPAIKSAEEKPFRIAQRGNRIIVVGADVSDDQ